MFAFICLAMFDSFFPLVFWAFVLTIIITAIVRLVRKCNVSKVWIALLPMELAFVVWAFIEGNKSKIGPLDQGPMMGMVFTGWFLVLFLITLGLLVFQSKWIRKE